MSTLLHLDGAALRAALDWDDLIVEMEKALIAFSAGEAIQPLRNWMTLEENERYFGIMPAAVQSAMGVKVVSLYPKNAAAEVPTIMALVLLFRADTGEPIALVDGDVLTAMRTAAVSAAVTKRLAPPESRVLALLGSGVQAESHLQALRHVRSFDEIRVWSRTSEHAERFALKHGARATSAESAVRGADVIVTATAAHNPILKGEWLKPGAHVNSIGAPMPTWREIDDEAMAHTLVVESREAALAESGDVILSGAQIEAEIGEVFAGAKSISASNTTIYKSVGMAVEDVAAAKLAFDIVSSRAKRSDFNLIDRPFGGCARWQNTPLRPP